MFEEGLPSAPPPGDAPVTEWPVAWPPPDLAPGDAPGVEWSVAWPPYDDPGVGGIDPVLLGELCTGGTAGVVVDVEGVPVGPDLAGLLGGFDPSAAAAGELVEAGAGCARLAAWVAGMEAAVHAELVSRADMRPDPTGYRSVDPVTNTAVEVAARCHVTAKQAENLVGHALHLVTDFPSTHPPPLPHTTRAERRSDECAGGRR